MNEQRVLRGSGVSPGVACAPAMVIQWRFPDVPDRSVQPEEVDGEISRLRAAIASVVDHLLHLRDRVLQRAGLEESRIFDAQILMAQDEDFLASVEHLIRENNLSAETAFEFKALEIRALWSGTGSLRLRERLTDLSAIQMRVLRVLMGTDEEELAFQVGEQCIVVAHELSPGLTVQLDRDHVVGLISEEGTRTSHAAIVAHSLGIPAVMGAPGALEAIAPGTLVLLDGQSGRIVLDPTPHELDLARTQVTRRHKLELELESVAQQPAVTPDGRVITLMGNVDLPEEIDLALRNGAEGVGLLRTEFLVTGRTELPSEEEQLEYFRRVAHAFAPRPVVIRTFDLGGDKFPAAFDAPQEANPFLGWRSIRVCLDQPDIFRPQIRAILRAAAEYPVHMMLPLITRVEEVHRTHELIAEEAASLRRAGVPAAASVPVGVMVETPAAVIVADRLAKVSRFFSVGSNDLTQYTLVVDRGNARLANRFAPQDPAVVRQLQSILAAGEAEGIEVSVCGEMASEPLLAVLLIGLGYRRLSVAPPALLLLRWIVRKVPFEACRVAAENALLAETSHGVEEALRQGVKPFVDLRLLDLAAPLPGRTSGASLVP